MKDYAKAIEAMQSVDDSCVSVYRTCAHLLSCENTRLVESKNVYYKTFIEENMG